MPAVAANPGDQVDVKGVGYVEMSDKWPLVDDLRGGTKTMREAKTRWLPMQVEESQAAYDSRLGKSFLYNAYSDTVRKLASKPFSKAVALRGDLSDRMLAIEADVDRLGKSLTSSAKDSFEVATDYGLRTVLVDYPRTSGDESAEEEKQLGLRPFFTELSPKQILGWQVKRRPGGGTPMLSQLRIKETRTESSGKYGDELVEYITVWTPQNWTQFKKAKNTRGEQAWVPAGSDNHTFGEIPVRTMYFNKTGFMTGSPVLEDLAWKNVEHWQSSSHQRHILTLARLAILFGKGMPDEIVENGLELGSDRSVLTELTEADMKFVEINGQSIKAGLEDLARIEAQLMVLGLQPQVTRSGNITATEKAIDEGRVSTDIQAWVRVTEQFYEELFQLAAGVVRETLPEDFKVDIYSDFGLSVRAIEDINALIKVWSQGGISHLTLLNEIRRRGVLSEEVNPADEIELIGKEGPNLNTIGTGDDTDDDDDDDDQVDDDAAGTPGQSSAA